MAERTDSALRLIVGERAEFLCEYCLIAEEDTFIGCEVDHIISVEHGGMTEADNLAFACSYCNRYKGSDIASISALSGNLVRFFNPRSDRWSEHFRFDCLHIDPLTEIGEVTTRIRQLNHSDRILERQELEKVGRYPCARATYRSLR